MEQRASYRSEIQKASLDDLELLTKTRIQVLRAANRLNDSADMSEVEAESRAYYKRALADGTHTAYLVFDGETFVGAGGISYYTVMPTFHNPTGKKAYVMNMYTAPAYRRKGIAAKTLDLLVQDAKGRGSAVSPLKPPRRAGPSMKHMGLSGWRTRWNCRDDAHLCFWLMCAKWLISGHFIFYIPYSSERS